MFDQYVKQEVDFLRPISVSKSLLITLVRTSALCDLLYGTYMLIIEHVLVLIVLECSQLVLGLLIIDITDWLSSSTIGVTWKSNPSTIDLIQSITATATADTKAFNSASAADNAYNDWIVDCQNTVEPKTFTRQPLLDLLLLSWLKLASTDSSIYSLLSAPSINWCPRVYFRYLKIPLTQFNRCSVGFCISCDNLLTI